jgi:SAM-dependent methyltransferase
MSAARPNRRELKEGTPSRLLLSRAHEFSHARPVLDVGCGVGRNAIAMGRLGLRVVCVDRDNCRLRQLADLASVGGVRNLLVPICAELEATWWPFRQDFFSAIVCIHFLDLRILPLIHSSLCAEGYLFIESVGGHGENHRELPRAGEVRALLSPLFHFDFYDERRAGPAEYGKCSVRLLARKRVGASKP